MKNAARLFNCALCHCQVIICSDCDRGNIYCGSTCSRTARRKSLCAAGKRYQESLRGRHQHALRQQRYRRRQMNKVTHQGSADLPPHASLPPALNHSSDNALPGGDCCHFCGKRVSAFLRRGFLHTQTDDRTLCLSSFPLGP